MCRVGQASFRAPAHPTIFAFLLVFAASAPAADIAAQHKQLDAAFAKNLDSLTTKCAELGLDVQAAITRKWMVRRDARRQTLFLPADSDTPRPPADAPELEKKWHGKFREHRNAHAAALFKLA